MKQSVKCPYSPGAITRTRYKRNIYMEAYSLEVQETFARWLRELEPPTCHCMAGKFPGGSPTG
jgi:hypothetical protein